MPTFCFSNRQLYYSAHLVAHRHAKMSLIFTLRKVIIQSTCLCIARRENVVVLPVYPLS
uniref:Uncharacterized protein n=1 Tax=Anguilla anguilla TaxID=7936 RepID=A0A0E9XB32_ANGAN